MLDQILAAPPADPFRRHRLDLTAAEAVRLALEALPQAAPHMRDYIGRDDDYRAAEAAHGVRQVLLKQVKNELFSLASHAAVQLEKRA